jgi:hypothetical protein
MPSVMPSQVVQTIDQLFPHAVIGRGDGQLQASHSPQLIGILNLIKAVPAERIGMTEMTQVLIIDVDARVPIRPITEAPSFASCPTRLPVFWQNAQTDQPSGTHFSVWLEALRLQGACELLGGPGVFAVLGGPLVP